MNNKKLLILLLSVAFYVKFASPYGEKIDTLKDEILYLNMKIQKEESIKENRKKIQKKLDKALKIAKENEEFLYKPDENNSEIQGKLQMFLKETASKYYATFINAAWNEPYIDEKNRFIELPITASIKGTPDAMNYFFKNIYKSKKLVNIKNLDIGKMRPLQVYFSITISGYKLMGQEQDNE